MRFQNWLATVALVFAFQEDWLKHAEIYAKKLADGSRAFSPVIERVKKATPPPQEAPTPKDNNKYDLGLTAPGREESPQRQQEEQRHASQLPKEDRDQQDGPTAAAAERASNARAQDAIKDRLADWPSDAPIELRPRVGRAAIDQQAALKKARQYLGIEDAKELRLTPAYLTDNDFPFLRPQKRPIWLVEVRDLRIPAPRRQAGAEQEPKPGVLTHLYVAIDAENGQLIEAFTSASRSWWRNKKQVIGAAHEKLFRETGQTLERSTEPPKLTLTDALRGLADGDGHAQLVVRHAVYTNTAAGRIEGSRFLPAAERRPALLVFCEGLRLYTTRGSRVAGRRVLVLDAETGAMLHNEEYGNPEP